MEAPKQFDPPPSVPLPDSALDTKVEHTNYLTGGNVFAVGIIGEGYIIKHFVNAKPLPGAVTLCGLTLQGEEYKESNHHRTCMTCGKAACALKG